MVGLLLIGVVLGGSPVVPTGETANGGPQTENGPVRFSWEIVVTNEITKEAKAYRTSESFDFKIGELICSFLPGDPASESHSAIGRSYGQKAIVMCTASEPGALKAKAKSRSTIFGAQTGLCFWAPGGDGLEDHNRGASKIVIQSTLGDATVANFMITTSCLVPK